jgi:hypothetical protein
MGKGNTKFPLLNGNSAILGFVAHLAFIGALIMDDISRGEISTFWASAFAIGSAFLGVPALLLFGIQPRCFFLLRDTGSRGFQFISSRRSLKTLAFILSWCYLLGWAFLWLIFASELPRIIASYFFLFAVVTVLLTSDHLFFRDSK